MNDFDEAYRMDVEFSKWAAAHRRSMGQDLQYEEKYDLARAAFEGGYKLALSEKKNER